MDNALPRICHRKLRNPELLAVPVQCLDLQPCNGISDPGAAIGRGYVVVCDSQVCCLAPRIACRIPQACKCLCRGHLMQELQIDVNQSGAILGFPHEVLLPEFVVKGFSSHLCLLEGGRF